MPATTTSSAAFAIPLAAHALLACGPVRFSLEENATFFLAEDIALPKPYCGTVIKDSQGRRHYIMLLAGEMIDATRPLPPMTLHNGKERQEWPHHTLSDAQVFHNFFAALPQEAQREIFHTLANQLARNIFVSSSLVFHTFMLQLRHQLHAPRATLSYGSFLAPGVLYFEAKIKEAWPAWNVSLTLHGTQQQVCSNARLFQIDHEHFAGVAIFDAPVYEAAHDIFHITLWQERAPVLVDGGVSSKTYGLEFVQTLNAKPDYQKHIIREQLCSQLLAHMPAALRDTARELIQKLQRFVTPAPEYIADAAQPFALHLDHIIPIGTEGVFITGWLRDPYTMLEEIEALSDLGFTLKLTKNMFRFHRPDVTEAFKNAPYGAFEEKHGFVCYARVPEAMRTQMQGLAELHAFRFLVRLQGNATLHLVPESKHRDAFAGRDLVLKAIPAQEVSEAMLQHCIGPAASAMHDICMQQVAVREEVTFGALPKKPKVSLVIPLYRQLEFLKIQFAVMANDPDRHQCEVVYVLDSPEQEMQVRTMLGELSLLYNLPARLVIMARNSGYAAATHAGALRAKGAYLVLLNSDVIPKTKGWVLKMAAFYARQKNIGALGAKLLYEDGSLQHAGMYFDKVFFPSWVNMHYYKGYPGVYAAAAQNRAVPAVTGACLMISAERYREIGGISTDYVVGDFEDSDLCLRCHSQGWENWYFADAELYHLERQSVPLNESYQGSLAWPYNALQHTRRWDGAIEQLMQRHKEDAEEGDARRA